MTLTLTETEKRLQTTDFEALPKPRKNKGVRGQLLELALGIPNSSKLTDLVDGELKSYTKGESVAVILIITPYATKWGYGVPLCEVAYGTYGNKSESLIPAHRCQYAPIVKEFLCLLFYCKSYSF